jgi:hypothetical protein
MVAGSTREYVIGMDIRLDTYIGPDVHKDWKQTTYAVVESVSAQDISSMSLRELTSNECAGRIVLSLLSALVDMITLGMVEEPLREGWYV